MRRLIVLGAALSALLFGGMSTIVAQEATPVTSPGAEVSCDVAPRTAEELLALWYGPDGEPIGTWATPMAEEPAADITIPTGEPADEATAAAITSVVHQVFACFDAGNFLAASALFTDDLAATFGPEPGTTFEDAQAFLTAAPEPAPEGEESEILAVSNAVVLDGGRVAAFVVEQFAGVVSVSYAIFEQVGDSWLVDEVIEFPSPIDE